MSQKERDWLEWLKRAEDGVISQREAAERMGVSAAYPSGGLRPTAAHCRSRPTKVNAQAARRVLERIGGVPYAESALDQIRRSIGSQTRVRSSELLAPGVRRLLGIGIVLAVLQQWSGINVIFNYAEEIYRGAGYGVSGILFNIVITGAINLAFTLAFTLVALGLIAWAAARRCWPARESPCPTACWAWPIASGSRACRCWRRPCAPSDVTPCRWRR